MRRSRSTTKSLNSQSLTPVKVVHMMFFTIRSCALLYLSFTSTSEVAWNSLKTRTKVRMTVLSRAMSKRPKFRRPAQAIVAHANRLIRMIRGAQRLCTSEPSRVRQLKSSNEYRAAEQKALLRSAPHPNGVGIFVPKTLPGLTFRLLPVRICPIIADIIQFVPPSPYAIWQK